MFDKTYFDNIWGTVHRHDYCETLADQLIAKYSPKTLLDIGGGCGYLVKVLRDRGLEAWNLEVSDYAVANSHGFTLKGDVRNIPLKDNSFDVVHSHGVLAYLPIADIDRAWAECKRVGIKQEHGYETTETGPILCRKYQLITIKPLTWWEEKLV